jgi:hypothetical protein
MAEDLPLGAPADRDIAQLAVADAEESRSSDLRIRDRRRALRDACNESEVNEFHGTLRGWTMKD